MSRTFWRKIIDNINTVRQSGPQMNGKQSTRKRIATLVKQQKPFVVIDKYEQRTAYDAAFFLGVQITTRKIKGGSGFQVIFL